MTMTMSKMIRREAMKSTNLKGRPQGHTTVRMTVWKRNREMWEVIGRIHIVVHLAVIMNPPEYMIALLTARMTTGHPLIN